MAPTFPRFGASNKPAVVHATRLAWESMPGNHESRVTTATGLLTSDGLVDYLMWMDSVTAGPLIGNPPARC